MKSTKSFLTDSDDPKEPKVNSEAEERIPRRIRVHNQISDVRSQQFLVRWINGHIIDALQLRGSLSRQF